MGVAAPHGSGRAGMWGRMWGRALGGGPPLLPLLLLLPGAVGLRCLRCGAGAGSCPTAANVTCDDVCAEAEAAASWSHGSFRLWGRGCGRGQPGGHARALQLFGLVVFVRSRQCREGDGCNGGGTPSPPGEPALPGNASARVPNEMLCYGCPDDGPCTSPTVVQCYDDLTACFHGNVTLTLDGISQWRELRGCARASGCAWASRGDGTVRLSGSCCAGALCNGPPANRTLFAPDRPRLQLLPHGHAPSATPSATPHTGEAPGGVTGGKMADTGSKMAASDPKMAANDSKMAVTGSKMAASDPKMAASDPKMAANDTKMAASDPNMAASDPKMASNDTKMAASDPKMAEFDPKMAASDPSGDKMAAGSPAPRTQRPLERKHVMPGPVGRGQPSARPGWLLPLLLLPRL